MLVAEQELAVEVAQVDCVEVDDVDFTESSEDEVLEQLTANAASSYHEHARLPLLLVTQISCCWCLGRTFLTMPCRVPPRLC